ncbi:MAG: phosphotransferase [Limnochordia bacterium]
MVIIKELLREERDKIARREFRGLMPKNREPQLIYAGNYTSLFRVVGEGKILKIASEHRIDREEIFYQALSRQNVPVIGWERLGRYALLLEDLTVSGTWRLATVEDLKAESVGLACAQWFQAFHQAGRRELKEKPQLNEILTWEYDVVSEEALHMAGNKYDLSTLRGWQEVCALAPQLLDLLRQEIDTFTYNDFYYVNLAISIPDSSRITMFDFDHSGRGLAESDYANVTSSLQGPALEAFRASMPVDKELLVMNRLLSSLQAVVVAAQRERTPEWGWAVVEEIRTNKLAEQIEWVRKILAS